MSEMKKEVFELVDGYDGSITVEPDYRNGHTGYKPRVFLKGSGDGYLRPQAARRLVLAILKALDSTKKSSDY